MVDEIMAVIFDKHQIGDGIPWLFRESLFPDDGDRIGTPENSDWVMLRKKSL